MNVQLPVHMDKSAFLAWVEGREGRYELANGRVVMMVNATRTHGVIVANVVVMLREQLDPQQWTVIADFGLDTGPKTLRFPDIMVDAAGGKGSDRTATASAFLAEVLSPSTARYDLGDKAAEFLRLPSVLTYAVFAQDERKAWVWTRRQGGFPPGPEIFEGRDAVIDLVSLGIRMPLADVYAHVDID